MSGPKVSSYELERRRQEELRRQYLEQQRRIEAHRRQQEEFRASIRRNIARVETLQAEVNAIVHEIGSNPNCRFNRKAFQNLCAQAESVNKHSMELHNRSELSVQDFESCRKALERIIEQLIQQNQKALGERMALESSDFVSSLQSLRSITGTQKSPQRTQAQDKAYKKQVQETYSTGCSVLAKALADMPEKAEQIHRLQKWLDSEVKELGGTAQETYQAAADCQREIAHQVNIWKKEENRRREAEARRSELVRRYHYYCGELALPRMSVEELAAQDEHGLESLCATLDNALYRQYEENYIFECINEAMAELGYTLYGKGAKGIRGQYLYRMHGDTVVHVSCSDQGIIAMEVGRAAAGQRQLDAVEVAEQVQDMETFCGDYAALQQSLARKGVRCRSNLVMSPPHPAYAQVLDTSEYELEKTVETEAVQTVYRYIDAGG